MKVTQIQTEPFDALLAQAAHPALASEIPNPSDRTNKDYSLLISLKTSLHLPEKILSTKICCSDMPLSRELHDEFLGKYLV
jgi:hypothetical protein